VYLERILITFLARSHF
ncbi:hypothetical protein EC900039_2108B, partial [Escherichia coli 90.0039]